MTAPNEDSEEGTLVYDNWKAASTGMPSRGANETPLFTDAHIVGELSEGLGPYKLLNTVPIPRTGALVPAIVLRDGHHLVRDDERVRKRTDTRRYHGGGLSDEIAALVSLCLGIRLQAGGCTRMFLPGGDPRGHPEAWEIHKNPLLLKPVGQRPVLPRMIGKHKMEEANRLSSLPSLDASSEIALVRSARLYQDAVWVAEIQPKLSWLWLVSAVEVAAGKWNTTIGTPAERLKESWPDVAGVLEAEGGEQLIARVAPILVDYVGVTRKFRSFILNFLPEAPEPRPPENAQIPWDSGEMDRMLGQIYNYRSHALHRGNLFPEPMCDSPIEYEGGAFSEIPQPGARAIGALDGVWERKDMPMLLHTFEHIVRGALLKWWDSITPA
jgi:hypothetical protein